MTERCRGIMYRHGEPTACDAERGNCIFHDAEGKMFPEDAWGRRLPYDEATKQIIDRQMRRSRGYDGGVEDERAAVVAFLRAEADCLYKQAWRAGGSGDTQGPLLLWGIADRIERGDHPHDHAP